MTDYDDSTLTYTYDAAENVLTMTDYHGNTTAYTYNDIGQLATLTAPGSKVCGAIRMAREGGWRRRNDL